MVPYAPDALYPLARRGFLALCYTCRLLLLGPFFTGIVPFRSSSWPLVSPKLAILMLNPHLRLNRPSSFFASIATRCFAWVSRKSPCFPTIFLLMKLESLDQLLQLLVCPSCPRCLPCSDALSILWVSTLSFFCIAICVSWPVWYISCFDSGRLVCMDNVAFL